MKDIIVKAEKIATEVAQKLGIEIISVNFVFEEGMKILRVIADKEFGLDMDDSEALNIAIGEVLDQDEILEEEYFLEVSSVGAERLLKTERELDHAINRYVSVETIDKTIVGDLVENKLESLVLRVNNKGRMSNEEISKEDIKEVRLAIKF